MATKQVVSSPQAPAAVGPYSHAIRVGELLFCSGQIPLDPTTGALVDTIDVRPQTERVLLNLQAVLTQAGLTLGNVVKTTVFLTDLKDFGAMNEVYAKFFTSDSPARSTIQVAGLPKGAKVEIEAIAHC